MKLNSLINMLLLIMAENHWQAQTGFHR